MLNSGHVSGSYVISGSPRTTLSAGCFPGCRWSIGLGEIVARLLVARPDRYHCPMHLMSADFANLRCSSVISPL